MRKVLLFIILFTIPVCVTEASNRKIVASIPFEMAGSYVLVKVRINHSTPLCMILDTGVRNTIITELTSQDSLSLNYSAERDLSGLGPGNSLKAFVSDANIIEFGRFKLNNKSVFVLESDIFNLSKQIGMKINGLLGADFFEDYVVQIDYATRHLRFYKPDLFIVPKGYGVMPMTVEKQKMFIHLSVLETDSARRSIKMMIDTGAQLNAWFQTLTNASVHVPEKSIKGRIGEGLNGEITGIFARVPQICIANFCVKNPIVAFPDSAAISQIIKNSDRDGTIGCQLLSRFNLIIDYLHRNFYFKPNSNFDKPFTYNVAGIEICQVFSGLPQVEVVSVWKDSPAEKAGVLPGDVIIEINYEQAFAYNVSQIKGFLEQTSKRPLKLLLQRGTEKVEVKLDMKGKI